MTPTTDPKPVVPFWTPLLALFSSRAFLLALGTAIVDALIIAVPSLEPLRGDFMNTITVLIGLLIAKMTAEDVNQVHSDTKVAVAKHQADAVIAASKAPPAIVSTPER